MKTILLFAVCLIICCESTGQNSSDEPCPAVSEEGLFNTGWILKDTTIIVNKDTSLLKITAKGKGSIFSYSRKFHCPDKFDDEHSDVLTWYVPDSVSEFEINFEKSAGEVAYYLSYVLSRFEMNTGKGSIRGSKQNNAWLITADLQMTVVRKRDGRQFSRVLQFSKMFIRAGYTGNNKKKKELSKTNPFYQDH